MDAQAVGEEEDLGMKAPGAHIAVEVGQVGVFGHGLVKWLPAQAAAEQLHQGGFAHADISGHSNKFFHRAYLKTSGR